VATAALQQAGDYSFIINAVEGFGRTKILSSPKIAVLNNQEAKILVGTKEAYVTTTVSQTGTGTAITSEQVNVIDVWVKLYVTPTISREGFISMKVRPEISSKTILPLRTSQGNEIPIVETSEAQTTVQVKDGNTVIIAGLMKNERSKNVAGIPFLSRLPILGIPFRSTSESGKQTELVILLTPRIVTGETAP
jgi:general secretion pathway protein D